MLVARTIPASTAAVPTRAPEGLVTASCSITRPVTTPTTSPFGLERVFPLWASQDHGTPAEAWVAVCIDE